MIVIDASVAVKWFLPEPLSDVAEAVLAGGDVRVAPEHILVEVGEALLRARRAGGITTDHVRRSVAALSDLVQCVPTQELATHAVDVAIAAGCTNYDALYVAAAERFDGILLTADRRLFDRLTTSRWATRLRLLGASQG